MKYLKNHYTVAFDYTNDIFQINTPQDRSLYRARISDISLAQLNIFMIFGTSLDVG